MKTGLNMHLWSNHVTKEIHTVMKFIQERGCESRMDKAKRGNICTYEMISEYE